MALAASTRLPVLASGAAWTDHTIKLWELPSFRQIGELSGHEEWIAGLAFSPDGSLLASGGADQTVRLWDWAARKQKWVSKRLPAEVWRVRFKPDGTALFGGCNDGSIHRWPLPPRMPPQRRAPIATDVDSFAIDSKGTNLAIVRQGQVWLGQMDHGQLDGPIQELGATNVVTRFTVDGRFLIAGDRTGTVRVWSLAARKLERVLSLPDIPVTGLRLQVQALQRSRRKRA